MFKKFASLLKTTSSPSKSSSSNNPSVTDSMITGIAVRAFGHLSKALKKIFGIQTISKVFNKLIVMSQKVFSPRVWYEIVNFAFGDR